MPLFAKFLIAIGLVFAGATGNLIDSMFYDYAFEYDPCMPFNHLAGSGVESDCAFFGTIETRHTGFLFGNVVDMFKFHAYWPDWVPYLGKKEAPFFQTTLHPTTQKHLFFDRKPCLSQS